MSTDLENELRDALQTRARAITPLRLRYPDAPRRRGTRPPAWLVAAAVVVVAIGGVAAVALTLDGGGRGTAGAHRLGATLVDTRWRVVAVTDGSRRTAITSRRVVVDFGPGGRFAADDGVNYYSGHWRLAADGLHVTDVGTTLVGYSGGDPAVLAAQRGMTAVTAGTRPVLAQLHRTGGRADTLRLIAEPVVLDLVADGRPDAQGASARPSPTAT